MTKGDLELLLKQAGAIAREHHFILFGSQAIWGLLKRVPKELTASLEADLYPRAKPQAIPLLEAALGRRSRFFRTHGFYADCVAPELATFPNGWEERLVPFVTKNTGGVTGWCVEIHDLAISKLVAGRKKDLEYIGVLLKKKLLRRRLLSNRLAITMISGTRKSSLKVQIQQLSERKQKNNRRPITH